MSPLAFLFKRAATKHLRICLQFAALAPQIPLWPQLQLPCANNIEFNNLQLSNSSHVVTRACYSTPFIIIISVTSHGKNKQNITNYNYPCRPHSPSHCYPWSRKSLAHTNPLP